VTPRQLAFDLNLRPALGDEDFLVAPSNEEAVAWIDRYPDWPSPAVVIVGPPGAGKTHLGRVFMARTEAVEIGVGELAEAVLVLGDAPKIFIDDASKIAGDDAAEEGLFHLYNKARSEGGAILLTATEAPARWPLALPDLTSRLKAAPAPVIGMPDDALLTALLVKLFADRQLTVSEDVLDYVIPRMERSFAAARSFVSNIDQLALEKKRPITVPLAREILNG
jgi:DnaA regulatory inactivator Hda